MISVRVSILSPRIMTVFNDYITFGLHRLWKKKLVKSSGLKPKQAARVLDLCCGSGDISLMFAHRLGAAGEVTALDFSAEMLGVLKKRLNGIKRQASTASIKAIQQDVTSLKNFSDHSFDAVSIGFGLRNLRGRSAALSEILRVLRPKARFLILDVGKIDQPFLKKLHAFYFERIVPLIGYFLEKARRKHDMYAYLPASSQSYPSQQKICEELKKAGFENVHYKNLLFGSAVIHVAHKPAW